MGEPITPVWEVPPDNPSSKYLSPAEAAHVTNLYLQEWSILDIAKRVGVSRQAISRRLQREFPEDFKALGKLSAEPIREILLARPAWREGIQSKWDMSVLLEILDGRREHLTLKGADRLALALGHDAATLWGPEW